MINGFAQSGGTSVWMSLDHPEPGKKSGEMLLYQSDAENCSLKILPKGQFFSTGELKALYERFAQKSFEAAEAGQRLLQPLLPKAEASAWLDELVINNFYSGLCEKYPALKLASLLSFDYFNRSTEEHNAKEFELLATKLTKLGRRKEDYLKLKNAHIIFWPIHDTVQQHWYLLIIEKSLTLPNDFSIRGIDGFNLELNQFAFAQKAEILLRKIYGEVPLHITIGSYAVPLQSNSNDCGVVGAFYAQRLCEGMDIRVYEKYANKNCNYELHRFSMATLIAPHPPALFFNYGRVDAKTDHSVEECEQAIEQQVPGINSKPS